MFVPIDEKAKGIQQKVTMTGLICRLTQGLRINYAQWWKSPACGLSAKSELEPCKDQKLNLTFLSLEDILTAFNTIPAKGTFFPVICIFISCNSVKNLTLIDICKYIHRTKMLWEVLNDWGLMSHC